MSDQASTSSSSSPAGSTGSGGDGAEVTEGQGAEASKEQTTQQALAEKRRIKIDDEELDEEEVVRRARKAKGADDTFREASKLSKSAQAFIKALQEDPERVLSDPRLPIDKKALAQKWLREQIEEELQDPHEKALKEKDQELKRYKDKEESERVRQEQEEYGKVVNQKKNEIGTALSKAMELSPLSKDPELQAATLREMALYLRVCKQRGWNPSPEEIAQHVSTSKLQTLKHMASKLSVEDLISSFGEEFIQKLHKHALEKLRAGRQRPEPEVSQNWEGRGQSQKREFVDPLRAVQAARTR